jgi:CBS-domain-containing membrane protein
MNPSAVTLRPETLLKSAIEIMWTAGFRHLPVVDAQEHLVGILSDRDVRNVAVFLKKHPEGPDDYLVPETTRIADIMTPDPITIGPDDETLHALEILIEHRFGCLPVVDERKLVGILTEVDLLKLLRKLLDNKAKSR